MCSAWGIAKLRTDNAREDSRAPGGVDARNPRHLMNNAAAIPARSRHRHETSRNLGIFMEQPRALPLVLGFPCAAIYFGFWELVRSRAAWRPCASFTASSFAQKCMK